VPFHSRRGARAAVAVLAALTIAVTASCGSSDSSNGTTGSSTVSNSATLGPDKPATGTAIKIGMVTDGKTDAVDHTAVIAAFKGTVQYVNEHLAGINGHKIEVDECSTGNTPSGATSCAVQMANDKVAAVLVTASAQDGGVFNGLKGSGIPYVTYSAANADILLGSGAFILTNPVAAIAAPAKLAKDKSYDKAGFILIDVPAATGPISAIATPIFAKAGVQLAVTPISPQTADMSPQIQQAINDGAKSFTVTGTDDFAANAIKTLKQLGFTGDIILGTPPTPEVNEAVPGGLEGVINNTTVTGDQNDPDVQLYNAVMATYASDASRNSLSPWAFSLVLGFARALDGQTSAVDAATVTTALGAMPKPVELPMGGGITFQCGSKPVPFAAPVCAGNILTTTLNADGVGTSFTLLDVSQYMTLG
jgi:branched-chain amino acid transport system substrate-binding protein